MGFEVARLRFSWLRGCVSLSEKNMELRCKPRFARLRYFASLSSSAKVYFFTTRWNERGPARSSFLCYRWENVETVVSLRAKTGRDAGDGGDSRWTDHRAKTRAACFRGRQTWSVCVPRNTACEFALKKENTSEKNTRLISPVRPHREKRGFLPKDLRTQKVLYLKIRDFVRKEKKNVINDNRQNSLNSVKSLRI